MLDVRTDVAPRLDPVRTDSAKTSRMCALVLANYGQHIRCRIATYGVSVTSS